MINYNNMIILSYYIGIYNSQLQIIIFIIRNNNMCCLYTFPRNGMELIK